MLRLQTLKLGPRLQCKINVIGGAIHVTGQRVFRDNEDRSDLENILSYTSLIRKK